jgi:hypothetical protein
LYGVFLHADILDTLKTVHVPLFQIISLHGMYIHINTCDIVYIIKNVHVLLHVFVGDYTCSPICWRLYISPYLLETIHIPLFVGNYTFPPICWRLYISPICWRLYISPYLLETIHVPLSQLRHSFLYHYALP